MDNQPQLPETIIKPTSDWAFPDFVEPLRYRDLFLLLFYRDIKRRYAQSILGIGWAFIQPLIRILVFSIIFGKMAKINSEGIPYPIYSGMAIIPWTFFINSLSNASTSLKSNSAMLTKVYFPRIILPLSTIAARLVDFSISFTILIFMMIWYQIFPTPMVIFFPLFLLISLLSALGIGLWLTSLGVKYRDINYSLSFFISLGMYVSPVVYGINQIPEKYLFLYSLNPMVGVLEGIRSIFLNTNPIPWSIVGIGCCSCMAILISGLIVFKRTEKYFADVV